VPFAIAVLSGDNGYRFERLGTGGIELKKKKKFSRTRKHDPRQFPKNDPLRRFVPRTREAYEQPQNGSVHKKPESAA
jgi:hypothetical protein